MTGNYFLWVGLLREAELDEVPAPGLQGHVEWSILLEHKPVATAQQEERQAGREFRVSQAGIASGRTSRTSLRLP